MCKSGATRPVFCEEHGVLVGHIFFYKMPLLDLPLQDWKQMDMAACYSMQEWGNKTCVLGEHVGYVMCI